MLLALLLLAACNGKSRPTVPPSGSDAGPPKNTAECDALAEPVAALYRAEATPAADEAGKAIVDEEIADNTAMILADCRTDPARFAPCVRAASTVAQLESQCTIPLDDPGTVEGRSFAPQ